MRRTNKTTIIEFSIIVAIAILFSTQAMAIGITPSKRVVNYEPGQKLTYGIDIINNAHENLDVTIYPKGEFIDNIKLSKQMVKLSSEDDSYHINIDFAMPDKIDIAGPHTIDIVAVGSEMSPQGLKAVVKADIAVISKFIIDVPYPDKYAESRIYVLDTELGMPVSISIPVFNKGSKPIGAAYAKIQIYSSDDTLVDELMTERQPLQPGESTKFQLSASRAYLPGEYTAKATVYYDEQQIDVETKFSVGELSIEIKNLVVNDFRLGDVANFDILLYNTWSTELKNVYADMQITGADNTVYTDFKTVAIDLPSHQIGTLQGYWYTQGVQPGIYTAKITLYYANKVSQKEFELEVTPNKITARGMTAGKAVGAPAELNLSNNSYIFVILFILVLVILALGLKLSRKKKQETLPAKPLPQPAPTVQEQKPEQQPVQQQAQQQPEQGMIYIPPPEEQAKNEERTEEETK